MSKSNYPSDSFDRLGSPSGRVGAHRAEKPGPSGWRIFWWAVLATLVLTFLGIITIQTISGRIEWFPQNQALPSISIDESEPGEDSVIDTSVIVLVLNGSSQTGVEEQFRQELLANGWESSLVLSGQSSTPFDLTTVFYRSEADRAAAAGVAGLLGGAELVLDNSASGDAASDDEVRELTVVIGADYGSQGAS